MKKLILISLLLPAFQSVQPTSEAKCKTLLGATLAGAAAYTLTYKLMDPCYSLERSEKFWLAAATIAGTLIGGNLAYYFTPDGRFERAKEKIASLNNNFVDIIKTARVNKKTFYHDINSWFFHSKYPLAYAFNKMKAYYQTLDDAEKLLHKAEHKEAFSHTYAMLVAKIQQLKYDIQEAILVLKSNAKWTEEAKNHETEQLRFAQERAARAQEDLAWQARFPQVHTVYVQ